MLMRREKRSSEWNELDVDCDDDDAGDCGRFCGSHWHILETTRWPAAICTVARLSNSCIFLRYQYHRGTVGVSFCVYLCGFMFRFSVLHQKQWMRLIRKKVKQNCSVFANCAAGWTWVGNRSEQNGIWPDKTAHKNLSVDTLHSTRKG